MVQIPHETPSTVPAHGPAAQGSLILLFWPEEMTVDSFLRPYFSALSCLTSRVSARRHVIVHRASTSSSQTANGVLLPPPLCSVSCRRARADGCSRGRRVSSRRTCPPSSAPICAFLSVLGHQSGSRKREGRRAQIVVNHTHSFLQSLYALGRSAWGLVRVGSRGSSLEIVCTQLPISPVPVQTSYASLGCFLTRIEPFAPGLAAREDDELAGLISFGLATCGNGTWGVHTSRTSLSSPCSMDPCPRLLL
ncbi:hypothetical protein GE09DRAFT_1154781 [Coniochaeta sp. 2T2.1]|nr:hypothetical protein GE09DRAFT_1154781 [Coniochaeta sp. 2T2.1]